MKLVKPPYRNLDQDEPSYPRPPITPWTIVWWIFILVFGIAFWDGIYDLFKFFLERSPP